MRSRAAVLGLHILDMQPDYRRQIAVTPDDPQYQQQWHLHAPMAGNMGVDAEGAWDLVTGTQDIVIAVIDTGVRFDHPDLQGQLLPGYDFIDDVPTANDGDGRDNDPSDPGDWVTSAESTTSGGAFEGCNVGASSWHGTHVSGITAARSNNNTGVAGVAWGAKILPVRALGKCGGYDSDLIAAVLWSAGLPVPGVPANPTPARIINLSLSGPGTCTVAWQNAVTAARNAGAVLVAAAGNWSSDVAGATPANCNGVIAVAASTTSGGLATFSNRGAGITLSAPGSMILSTSDSGATAPAGAIYATSSGTSMASPMIAGVIALMLSRNGDLTPSQVMSVLANSASAFPTGSTCTTSLCGSGILNARNAVIAAGMPAPPTVSPTWTPSPAISATHTPDSTPKSTVTPVLQAPKPEIWLPVTIR